MTDNRQCGGNTLCAAILFATTLTPLAASARECQHSLSSSRASVAQIIDGDTIVLSTRQRLRLIGINAHEINAVSPTEKLWADKATIALENILGGRTVTLLSGSERKDRYGRLLAHVRLADGRDAAAELIKRGLAFAVGVGRNTTCADDNAILESVARGNQTGLWQNEEIITNLQTTALEHGFHRMYSTVSSTSGRGKRTRLKLANGLSMKFGYAWPLDTDETDALVATIGNHIIEVRGWTSGGASSPELSLHHPANLRIVGD